MHFWQCLVYIVRKFMICILDCLGFWAFFYQKCSECYRHKALLSRLAKIIAYCQSVTERWTSLFIFFLSNYYGPNLNILFSRKKGQLKSQNVDWSWCNSYRQTRLHLFSPNLNQVSQFYIYSNNFNLFVRSSTEFRFLFCEICCLYRTRTWDYLWL